jgi:glycosyltransferase involved in cell wall biosynthesis
MKILIVLPAYNEELVIAKNTKQVLDFCQHNIINDQYLIIIADNKSTDKTAEIGQSLAQQYKEVTYLYIDQKGKGIAWRQAFFKYEADIYIVMDIDLAVDLEAVKLLINNIKQGLDVVSGSRYLAGSKIKRSKWRDLTSLVYRFLVRKFLNTPLSDFQCGFKAINNKVKANILPQTKDNGFFLDTEILILAEKQGYRIKEIPVSWSAFRDKKRKSTVKVFETTVNYLKKIWQLKKDLKQIRIKS